MPASQDHVFERLEVAVNAWNLEIGQMRSALGGELEKLGRQLEAVQVPPAPPEGESERWQTKAHELEALLERARARVQALEEQARQSASDAARSEGSSIETLNQRLLEALRDRDEAHQEIVALRAESDLLRRANAYLSGPLAGGPVSGTENSADGDVQVFDRDGHRRRIGQILLDVGLIDEAQLNEALSVQATQGASQRLGSILVEKGWASGMVIAKILARQFGLPYVDLVDPVPDAAACQALPAHLARRNECVPVAISPGKMVLAMANPFDLVAIENVELATGRRVDPVVAPLSQIRQALQRHYGAQEPDATV